MSANKSAAEHSIPTPPPLTKAQRKLVADKAKTVSDIQDLRKRVADINQKLISEGLEFYVTNMSNCW